MINYTDAWTKMNALSNQFSKFDSIRELMLTIKNNGDIDKMHNLVEASIILFDSYTEEYYQLFDEAWNATVYQIKVDEVNSFNNAFGSEPDIIKNNENVVQLKTNGEE